MSILDHPSVGHAVQRALAEPGQGARVALSSPHGELGRTALADAIAAVAARISDARVPRQAVVGVLSARKDLAACALLGAMQAGVIAWPIDARTSPDELFTRMRALGVCWLLADPAAAAALRGAGCPIPGTLIEVGAGGSGETYLDEATQPDDGALLLLTSGSTGEPKGIVLSHRNLLANAFGVAEHTGIDANDRLLHVMPIHHTNGINNQLITPLLCGAAVALMDSFSVSRFFEQVQAYRPSYVTGVPTMYMRLLAQPVPAGAMRTLRFARCGSAPISEDQHRAVEAHLGVPLIVSYGLSEATCTSTMNPVDARRIGSVGTVLAGQRVMIMQPGSDAELPAGAEGEVCIGGPCVMRGYVGADDRSPRGVTAAGVLRTGDLGRFDADGYLFVTGRIKDVIIRGGENLSPQLIESAVRSHPQILACAVVGAPDDDLGEVPVAFIVGREAQAIDPATLEAHVAERLHPRLRPAAFVPLPALPENGVGKIDLPRLRAMARGLARPVRQPM
ncbi:MAG: class I adenylate-forming enzyme family protein [Burkholderiaceae bacterium]